MKFASGIWLAGIFILGSVMLDLTEQVEEGVHITSFSQAPLNCQWGIVIGFFLLVFGIALCATIARCSGDK